MQISAIVLAAGRGERFQSRIPKPLVKINGAPLIVHCLKILNGIAAIKEIILVVNAANRRKISACVKKYKISKVSKVILGGERRQDSLGCALRVVDKRTPWVLIHDGVRPFIEKKNIYSLFSQARKSGAAILGVPVKATVKQVTSYKLQVTRVKRTIPRDDLWEIQTPQVFRKGLILQAYAKFKKQEVTDDAMLLEKMGRKVNVVPGSYHNIKVTTPEDLVIANAISRGYRL